MIIELSCDLSQSENAKPLMAGLGIDRPDGAAVAVHKPSIVVDWLHGYIRAGESAGCSLPKHLVGFLAVAVIVSATSVCLLLTQTD